MKQSESILLVALVGLVFLSVSEQHYSKRFARIDMKVYGEVLGGTKKNINLLS